MSPVAAGAAARTAPARTGGAAPQRTTQRMTQPRRSPLAPPAPPAPAVRPRPPLRVVPQRQSRRAPARAPFVLLVSAILGGGLVLLLLINTWLAQGSFAVQRLQQQQTTVHNQAQAIAQQIAAQSAPDALAIRAAELGLVPAPNPVFKTKAGAVLGVAQAAPHPAPPPAPATPSTEAAASPSASTGPSASTSPSPNASTPAKPSTPAQGGHG